MAVMWSAISALTILSLWGMSILLRRVEMSMTIGQWVIYLVWVLWTLFGLAFVWSSIEEGEPRAAKVGAIIFGGAALVMAIVLVWLWFSPQ